MLVREFEVFDDCLCFSCSMLIRVLSICAVFPLSDIGRGISGFLLMISSHHVCAGTGLSLWNFCRHWSVCVLEVRSWNFHE